MSHQPLTAHRLSYTYPGADEPALHDVSLTAAPGEIVGLLGPNGAGKSTLIALLTGLRSPDGGTVRLQGGDPRQARTRLALGVMLQATNLPPHLTVGELVRGAAVRTGRPKAAATAAVEEVGLADLTSRRATHLSGGQQRRLQLARALVTDPALLVLDEPTEGLDADARRRFWDNLAIRRDRGMAILLTTHLIEEAGAIADRVTVLARGRVVADDTPAALADRLPDRRVSVRTALPVTEVRALDGVDLAEVADGLTRITTRDPETVLRTLLATDLTARDLRVEGARLADAVMSLGHPHAITAHRHARAA